MSVFSAGGLDVLSRNGIESAHARSAWYRAVNHGISEFCAFELARAEAMAHADDAEVSRLNAILNPFERRRFPRVAGGQVAAAVPMGERRHLLNPEHDREVSACTAA